MYQRDEIVHGAGVQLAAAVARIDEGAEPDCREMPGTMRGDVAKELRNHALREVVSFDAVVDRESLEARDQSPVSADHAAHEAFMGEMVESLRLAVALARGIDERQVARRLAARAVAFR